MAEKQEPLGSDLENHGLDQKYWLQVFEKHGIRSKAALKMVKKDANFYSKVREEIRFNWEKKALKKLLNITRLQRAWAKAHKKPTDIPMEIKIPK